MPTVTAVEVKEDGTGSVLYPRTGQTSCHDTAGRVIGRAGTGQDAEIGAGSPWPEPRFRRCRRATDPARASASFIRAAIAACVLLFYPSSSSAELVAVPHPEGLTHGFIALRTLDGTALADGDLIQNSRGNRVTTRLILHFKDGSTHEETTVYMQRKVFRLVSNHVVQKGPAFKMPIDSTIFANGRVKIRYTDEDGKDKAIEERLELPADLANGLILAMLKNVSPETPKTTVSMLAITPKPRLVKLEFTPTGEEPFSTGGLRRKAMHYLVKVHVPGVTGVVASVLGKIPPDSHVWILGGEAPAFVKAELSLFPGGPIWRIESVSPIWPSGETSPATKDSNDSKEAKDGAR